MYSSAPIPAEGRDGIDPSLRLETLRSTSDAVRLMRQSWSSITETPLDYTQPLLDSFFDAPSELPHLRPALYHGAWLAGFVAALPRRARMCGRDENLALLTFFTVAPEWQGRGIGRRLWAECLRLAQRAGYDGAIHVCADGNRSNHVTVAASRDIGLDCTKVMEIRYLVSSLRKYAPASAMADSTSTHNFLDAAAAEQSHHDLARLWNPMEAEWHTKSRHGAICVTTERAAIAGYRTRLLDGAGTRCLSIDDVLWRNESAEGRRALLNGLLTRAARDCDVAAVPVLNSADLAPFFEAGFRRSPKVLHAYVTMWNGDRVSDFSSLYIDII